MVYHKALIEPNSAQVMYRPVLMEKIPALPNPNRVDFIECKVWWTEQYRRCTEGWVAPDMTFINPIYYFYLNFVKVPIIDELRGGKSGWSSPYYRDGDKEYFDAVYLNSAYKIGDKSFNAKNLFVAKGRRKGWTTAELFGITMWNFIFNQGFNISRAYPTDKIKNKERKLFEKAYSYINPFFKRNEEDEPIDILESNEDVIGQYSYSLNEKGTKIKSEVVNSIFFFTATATGGGVRGDALGLIVVVEAGVHKHLSSLYAAAEETLKLGTYKFGMMLVGGTSDAINNENTDYKEMFFNSEAFEGTSLFTPAWKCYFGAIDYYTGKSIKEKALADILLTREKLKNSGDYKAYRSKIQEHPISPEESFIPQGESEYDSSKIDNQLMAVLRTGMNKEWVRGKLEWEKDTYGKKTGKVLFEKNASGKWMILDDYGIPIIDVKDLYIAGIDDVYKDKAPHSKSKNAMVIYMKESIHVNGVSDLPVAFYLGRHSNRMIDYEEFHKGTVYYGTKVMYEHNDSGGYIGYARKHEIQDRFIYHNGQIGIRLSDDIKADFTILGLEWFEENKHERVLHSTLIESFKYWNSGINNDICSAFHLVLFGLSKTKKVGTKAMDTKVAEVNTKTENFNFFPMANQLSIYQEQSSGYFNFSNN